MTRFLRSLLRASRVRPAALLLGVFLAGAALHGLHHLLDLDCVDGVDHAGHACSVCGSMHGSVLVATDCVAPATLPAAWTREAPAPAPAPERRPRRAAVPRAPPAS